MKTDKVDKLYHLVRSVNEIHSTGKRLIEWNKERKDEFKFEVRMKSDHWMSDEILKNLRTLVRSDFDKVNTHVYDPHGLKEVTFGPVDGNRSKVVIEGHPVTFWISIPSLDDKMSDSSPDAYKRLSIPELHVASKTKAGKAAIERFVIRTVKSTNERKPHVKTWSDRYDEWSNSRPIHDRPIESIILRHGVRESLLNDIETFASSEDSYNRLGIPYHRGYLMYGPPGTGKTSVAQMLANQLKVDLFTLNLSSIQEDKIFTEAMNNLDKGVLLLEDIDTARGSASRDTDTGVTLGALLNALDGANTPHGLITIMTTNHVENLDPALIRPGRADYRIELSYVDNDQLCRMWKAFDGTDLQLDTPVDDLKITPAEVIEIFKNDLHTGNQDNLLELKKLIESK